jgi:hypothetical protein
MAEDTVAAVSAIFAEAGWRPMPAPPRAGLFCAESSGGYWLGGIAPNGAVHSSHTHMTDPPQDAETIARNLVAAEGRKYRFKRKATETVLPPPRIVLDEPGELAEDSGDENAEPVAEPVVDARCPRGAGDPDTEFDGTNDEDAERRRDYHPIDADFSEPAPELGQELAEEHPEEFGGAAFIFGDNLDQRRTAAIGMVMQAALRRLPAAIDYAQLSELRNFTMGVSEGRFADDPAKRDALDALEATERTRRRIEQARDDKVAGLMSASREEIEAFDPEAGWPQ